VKKIHILCLFGIMNIGSTSCMYQELVNATRIQNRFERLSKEYVRVANDGLAQEVRERSYGILLWHKFHLKQLERELYAYLTYTRLIKDNKNKSIAYRKKLRGRMAAKRV
jgi:hypothetical protein